MLTHSTTELITAKEISTNILFLMEKNKTKPHKNVETCRVAQKTRLEQWGHPSPYRQDRCPLNLPGGMCIFISQDIFISCSACRAEAKLPVKHQLRTAQCTQGCRTRTELAKYSAKLPFSAGQVQTKSYQRENPTLRRCRPDPKKVKDPTSTSLDKPNSFHCHFP